MDNDMQRDMRLAQRYAEQAAALLDPIRFGHGDEALPESAVYNALVVPCNPRYIPLSEESVRKARLVGDAWRFGARAGSYSRDVERLYQTVAFDYRSLHGDPMVVSCLRPDSLAAQMSFMAYLHQGIASRERNEHLKDLARTFLERHLAKWCDKASEVCRKQSYAWLAEIVSECNELVRDDLDRAE